MAKIYGKRWQVVSDELVGHGGQSNVLRVRDLTNQHAGEYALKRVTNSRRRARFENEIAAIKKLTDPETTTAHPNVIYLIDHSALDAGSVQEKQFLVMPLAQGGDLSNRSRIGLYASSVDAVLQVAAQIGSALSAAHSNGIIHRDVKPANILFKDHGHDLWLADFGICLLREADRATGNEEAWGRGRSWRRS